MCYIVNVCCCLSERMCDAFVVTSEAPLHIAGTHIPTELSHVLSRHIATISALQLGGRGASQLVL